MTRWYCDRCGKEIPQGSFDHDRLRANGIEGRYGIEVMVAVDNKWNAGLLCHDCVRALVAKTAPETP